MRRFIAAIAATAMLTGPALARDVPTPRELLAQVGDGQVDDSDMAGEETLTELIEIEVADKSMSMGAAIGLSLIPGGGFGLVYTGKKAQSVVPFLLSVAGYGVAGAYFLGAFDKSSTTACVHVRDNVVPRGECNIGNTAGDNQVNDPRSEDMMTPYFATKEDYETVKKGEDFDGKDTGVLIAIGTYAVTTLLGAIWAATVVADHNDQAQKDAESTAEGPRPLIGFDGEQGFVGIGLDF